MNGTIKGLLFGLGLGTFAAAAPASAQDELLIGLMCDRTGPTQTVGIFLCPGFHHYIQLVNANGGVEGHKLRVEEVDIEYKVPPSVEAYERFTRDGAVSIGLYGTPIVYALNQRLEADHVPGTSPGFGSAEGADGTRFPYLFPIAATYWSQMGGAVQFVKDQLGGLEGKKIAYLFYDNPAGREPLPIIEDLAKSEGFELRTFAVPPPGVEMGAQVLDIAQRFRPDFVITHLFGRSPSVSIKALSRMGYPLNKVVALVWGASEADIQAAGGWETAEGYYGIQFAGVGSDYPVHKEIRAMFEKQGRPIPSEMASTVFYNRGVLIAALHVQAIRNALKAKGGGEITGEDVAKGFEQISDFTLGGLVPPLQITPEDHEGGGWVKIFQVKNSSWSPATDWFQGYRELILKHLEKLG